MRRSETLHDMRIDVLLLLLLCRVGHSINTTPKGSAASKIEAAPLVCFSEMFSPAPHDGPCEKSN